jgi:hypothetical protein
LSTHGRASNVQEKTDAFFADIFKPYRELTLPDCRHLVANAGFFASGGQAGGKPCVEKRPAA